MYANVTCATFKKVKCLPSNKIKRKLRQTKHLEKDRASKEAKTQGSKLSQTDTFASDDIVKKKEAAQNKKREADRVYSARLYLANPEKRKLLLSKPIMLTQRNGKLILGKHLMLIGRKNAASKHAYHAHPQKWKAYYRKAFDVNSEKKASKKAYNADPEKWKAYVKQSYSANAQAVICKMKNTITAI